MHISLYHLGLEIVYGAPFVGALDATNSSVYSRPAGTVPLSVGTAWAVTRLFDPVWMAITATSNVAMLVVQ